MGGYKERSEIDNPVSVWNTLIKWQNLIIWEKEEGEKYRVNRVGGYEERSEINNLRVISLGLFVNSSAVMIRRGTR